MDFPISTVVAPSNDMQVFIVMSGGFLYLKEDSSGSAVEIEYRHTLVISQV